MFLLYKILTNNTAKLVFYELLDLLKVNLKILLNCCKVMIEKVYIFEAVALIITSGIFGIIIGISSSYLISFKFHYFFYICYSFIILFIH